MAWQLYNICCCSQTQGCSVSYVATPVISNQSTTATWSMANWSTFLDHQSHFRSIVSSTSHVRQRGPKVPGCGRQNKSLIIGSGCMLCLPHYSPVLLLLIAPSCKISRETCSTKLEEQKNRIQSQSAGPFHTARLRGVCTLSYKVCTVHQTKENCTSFEI